MYKKTNNDDNNNDNNYETSPTTRRREERKMVMARRALRSLIATLMANISLPIAIILLFGSGRKYNALLKPVWFPPLWLIHICTVCSSFFMGLAAWLVWADGGLHINSEALPIYVAQITLNVTWYPLVLVMGMERLGLFFWTVNFGAIVACYFYFRKVNHIAGCLVRPCVFWSGFLVLVTLKICLL